jgi:NADH-quinone oxidoreductase subunit M
MICVSVGFGIFPMHLYNVVRSGVDPLIAKITEVVPVASQPADTLPTTALSEQLAARGVRLTTETVGTP